LRRTLLTEDGVALDTVLLRDRPARTDAIVVASGFTGGWRRPALARAARRFFTAGDVAAFDYRGHHASGGQSTVGEKEILDVDAVVTYLRGLGYIRIALVGFSMGAAVAVRYAGLRGGLSAVVAVGGPAHWFYRGTLRMRLLHVGVERRLGRLFLRWARRVRVAPGPWDPVPADPTELAPSIAPTPLLVVHGEADSYFPLAHARQLYGAAQEPKELWVVPGMGHAESALPAEQADRIAQWIAEAQRAG
jgi:uncharacterized protein